MPVYLKTRQHTIKNKGIYVSVSCTSRHGILTSRHHILNNRIQINFVSDSILWYVNKSLYLEIDFVEKGQDIIKNMKLLSSLS